MFCWKCAEAIPDGSSLCPKCGANLTEDSNDQTIVYASQKNFEQSGKSGVIKKDVHFPKKSIIITVIFACIAIIIIIVTGVAKSNLKKSLVKDWYDVDDLIIKVLDINDIDMEYRLETGYSWMDTSLGTYEWKVVSGNKIKIKRFGDQFEIFTVELNDDRNVLTIMPAITSIDPSETWYHID